MSRVAAAEVARRLPGEPEVLVLPNAVEVGARAFTPERTAGAPVRLVSTMRIARRKRPLPLLEMLDTLRHTTATPVHLTLVGDGPRRRRVERWIERHDAADVVTLTGRREPSEVAALLAESDVYVAPALLESFGLAALEARCVGLPVVGLAASGLSEFVTDGVEGWLAGSDARLVDRLRDVVEDAGAAAGRVRAQPAHPVAADLGARARPRGRGVRPGRCAAGGAPDRGARGMSTLLAFHAHPDDEALLTGGTLARAAAEGHRVVLVTATDGARGLAGAADGRGATLARTRHAELLASAAALGCARVVWLGYADSGLSGGSRGSPTPSPTRTWRRPPPGWPRCSARRTWTC